MTGPRSAEDRARAWAAQSFDVGSSSHALMATAYAAGDAARLALVLEVVRQHRCWLDAAGHGGVPTTEPQHPDQSCAEAILRELGEDGA